MIKVRGRHVRRNALQTLRLFGRGKQLRSALIGKPVHADASVARGMIAQPGDCLGAIAALVAEGIESAL